MDQIESLLPGISEYIEHILSKENLSVQSELKRKYFLEKLELLDIGAPPDAPNPAFNPPQKSLSLPAKQVIVESPDYYEVPSRLRQIQQQKDISDEPEASSNLLESRELILPKRSQTQRFSGNTHLLEQPWTLVGPLNHRSKPKKWQRLAFSLLAGARLIGYKWTRSLTPSLNVFLYGHTAIYAGRDSGMDHVIKLTHLSMGTHVLAADTEKQALQWTAQINQYSQGLTPAKVISFMEDVTCEEECEDNVFVGMVSSSSSDGGSSGDGIIGQHQASTLCPGKVSSHSRPPTACNSLCSPQHHLIQQHNNSILSSSSNNSSPGHLPSSNSFANLSSNRSPLTDPLIQTNNSSVYSASTLLRSGGNLISTMKRKVESLGNRRKSRVFQFNPAKNSIISGMAKIKLPSQSHWHERWCQLTPGLLEAFKTEMSDSPQLDFALSLSQIVLDVSNDKKHPSALRLSSTSCSSEVLVFEVVEKDKLGEWIRAFISALGIIPSDKRTNSGTTESDGNQQFSDPIYDEVCSPHSINNQSGKRGPPFRHRPSYIPPPSRQLLAQPLPTVPSISSKATSLQSVLTGRTRSSSRCTGNLAGNSSSDDTTSSDTLTVIGGDGGSCFTVGQPCPSMMTSIMSYADSIILTGNNSEEEDTTGTLGRRKKITVSRRVNRRASVSEFIDLRINKGRYGHLRTSLSCSNLVDCPHQTGDSLTPVPSSNYSTWYRRERNYSHGISSGLTSTHEYNTDTIGSTQTAYSIDNSSIWGNLATENFESDEETDLDNYLEQENDSDQLLIEQASGSDRWCAALEPYLDWADVTLDRKSSARANNQIDRSTNPDVSSSSSSSSSKTTELGCTLSDLIARFECQSGHNASCELNNLLEEENEEVIVDLPVENRASLTLPHIRDNQQNQQLMRRCVSSDNGFCRFSSQTVTSNSTTTTSSSRYSVDSNDSSLKVTAAGSVRKCTLRRTSVEIASEEMEALKLDVNRLRRKKSDLRRSSAENGDPIVVETIEAIEQEIVLKSNRIEALQIETNKRYLFYINTAEDKSSRPILPTSTESSELTNNA